MTKPDTKGKPDPHKSVNNDYLQHSHPTTTINIPKPKLPNSPKAKK